jgi:eukaryotic-like serine/threonine-protein kinase
MSVDAQKARSIFLAAVEQHPPEQWFTYLDEACDADQELRKRVEVLLRAHQQANSLLDAPGPAPAADTWATQESPALVGCAVQPGTTIGPYKLLEQIGEGGFGVVFIAEQHYPVRRKVALKVIKPGMDTRQVIARFEAERQALALMDHPNIAKVLDGGTTGTPVVEPSTASKVWHGQETVPQQVMGSGRPYFVMELVRGIPITDYCDQCSLAMRERLDLFLEVCHAVQHAHQKGVIHRDIKPSNVLVAIQDGRPTAKVIDFGVAKAINQRLSEHTLQTGFHQLVGTPLYMSPEQAALSPLDVDTRADIYSLGVLLYELLTGTTPFEKARLREAGYDELRRIIREEEPPRPSARLSTLKGKLTTVAAQRRTEPRQLLRTVRGELDWIVMKALEKDRSRRYETANGLARDVQRYLADEPVQACPPSAGYRFRKFVKRNKAALALTGLLLALTLAVAGSLLMRTERDAALANLWRAERAEEALRAAQSRAEEKSHLAQARAHRWSGQVGQRAQALEELAAAARLNPSLELRNEAIACLALTDLQLAKSWEGYPKGSTTLVFDRRFERYARSDSQGNITVRRVVDDVELLKLPGPGRHAYNLCFSPNGQFLAAAHHDKGPSVTWDLGSGKLFHEGYAIFSPDTRHFMTFHHGAVHIHELASGKLVTQFSTAPGHHTLAFSPDGRRIAVTRTSNPRAIEIYDWSTGKVVKTIPHPEGPRDLSWHPSGRHLASTCGNDVYVWDVQSGEQRAILKGHETTATPVQFSSRGDLLVSSSWDSTLRLWDPMSGRLLLTKDGAACPPQFSEDDQLLAWTANGTTVELWKILRGQAACRLLHSPVLPRHGVWTVDVSADGRLLAAADSYGVCLWDLATSQDLAFLPTGDSRAAFNRTDGSLLVSGSRGLERWPIAPDANSPKGGLRLGPPQLLESSLKSANLSVFSQGRRTAVADPTHQRAMILDFEPKGAMVTLGPHPSIAHVAASSDGKWVATSTRFGFATPLAKIWDARNGSCVWEIPLSVGQGDAHLCFSPDSRWLVTCSANEYRFWRTGSWETERVIRNTTHSLCAPAFTRDGRIIALAPSPRIIQLLDSETFQELASLTVPPPGYAKYMTFDHDGGRLIAAGGYPVVQVWDLRHIRRELAGLGLDWSLPPYPPATPTEGREPLQMVKARLGEIRRLEGHTGSVNAAAFLPGNRHAISGSYDGTLRLWNIETGHEVRRFEGQSGAITCLALSADGRRALSAGFDRTMRLWDMETGKELRHFDGHTDIVWYVAFSPDGRRALSGSQDSTVREWDLETGRELHCFRVHLPPNATARSFTVSCVAYLSGDRALSTAWDRTVRWRDLKTGHELHRLERPDPVTALAVLPDGRLFLGDTAGNVWLIDAEGKDVLFHAQGHGATMITSVAISPDGRRALSAGLDDRVCLWDLETGQSTRAFRAHWAGVSRVAFSPDGRRALTAGLDNVLRLWDLEGEK